MMQFVFILKFNMHILKSFQLRKLTRTHVVVGKANGHFHTTKWPTVQGHLLFWKIRNWKTQLLNSKEIISRF
jgi:hypothetical protein